MKQFLKSIPLSRPLSKKKADKPIDAVQQPPGKLDLSRGLLLAGFARGGTTWARQVIAAHPDIFEVPGQVLFRPKDDTEVTPQLMEARLRAGMHDVEDGFAKLAAAHRFVTKAPPNSEILAELIAASPASRFLYIVRDPRDVLISHQRTGADWTDARRDFDMAMNRTAGLYAGYLRARDREALLTFTYEDLHQQFRRTYRGICEFADVEVEDEVLDRVIKSVSFKARTGRAHAERPGMYRRGVVGDWGAYLSYSDAMRFQRDPFWSEMMERHGYDWELRSTQSVVTDAAAAGVPACGMEQRSAGMALLWSLSGADWTYPPEIAARIGTALSIGDAAGYPAWVTVDEPLPDKVVAELLPLLQGRRLALEVDTDDEGAAEPAALQSLVENTAALLERQNGPGKREVLVHGSSRADVVQCAAHLQRLGVEAIATRSPVSNWQAPLGMLYQDSTAVMTAIGLPEDFDLRRRDSWQAVHDRATLVRGKVASVGVDAPLSLGFRDEFEDLRAV